MKTWFKITNAADGGIAEISLHDEIGGWGVSAKDFVAQLKTVSAKNLRVTIDSPGGDVNDGLTIFDAINAFKVSGGDVDMQVIGLAASMASVIMLAGSRVKIAENGRVMIHRVTGGVYGNADDLAAGAVLVKQMEDRIIAIYQAKTGKEESAIRDLMKADLGTWYFGQEAVDNGFADEVMKGVSAKAFKPAWAAMFTMLPAALLKDFDNAPVNMETPEKINEQEAEAVVVVETPAAEETPAVVAEPENAEESAEVVAEAPEAKGFFASAIAAVTGAKAKDAEIVNLKASLALASQECDKLRLDNATLKAKAEMVDELELEIEKAIASAKSASVQAAEIAAAKGFVETPENKLPAVEDDKSKVITRAEFEKIPTESHAAMIRSGVRVVD